MKPIDTEKRRAERATGLEVVEIGVAGSAKRRIGIIRDRSARGARIQIRDADDLPPAVLVFTRSDGRGIPAKVCWRRGCDIGIRYRRRLG